MISSPFIMLIAGSAVAIAGFGAGWGVNGWRLGAQIADLRAEHAAAREKLATDALDTIKADTQRVVNAADLVIKHQTALSNSFVILRNEVRNANRNPLPVDCRPDDIRMRQFDAAIRAANEAIARSKSGAANARPAAPAAP
jgi:hypothetical protein